MRWYQFWLILHVLGVVVAFGPTFAFGLIAAMSRKEPHHAAFGTEIIETIEKRMTLPLAVAVPLFGTALIYTAHIDLWKSEWLIASIILYTTAFFFSIFVQTPNIAKMLRLLRSMPGPPPGAGPGAGPGPGAGGAMGPPPEIAAQGKKLQMGGIILSLLFLSILVLMIWKPGASFT